MTAQAPRYSMEELVERGQFRYEQDIRPLIETDNKGKIVAIDIETGEYEVAENTLTASDRLYARIPDAQIWCVRIGQRGVHRIGLLSLPH